MSAPCGRLLPGDSVWCIYHIDDDQRASYHFIIFILDPIKRSFEWRNAEARIAPSSSVCRIRSSVSSHSDVDDDEIIIAGIWNKRTYNFHELKKSVRTNSISISWVNLEFASRMACIIASINFLRSFVRDRAVLARYHSFMYYC